MNINFFRSFNSHKFYPEASVIVSPPNQLLWAIIGLFLTIFGTFIEAFVTTNFPWDWTTQGIHFHSLKVTYQIGAVLLTGCLGGKNAGALAQIAYVVIGLFVLPVFADGGGEQYGLQYLQKPSFGYLLGFIPGAWLCGWLAFRSKPTPESLTFSSLGGLLVIHIFGLVYLVSLHFISAPQSPINELLTLAQNYSLYPLPGQLVIVCVVAVISYILRQILFY